MRFQEISLASCPISRPLTRTILYRVCEFPSTSPIFRVTEHDHFSTQPMACGISASRPHSRIGMADIASERNLPFLLCWLATLE